MYDFSNDAITAEHADVTFKKMENDFPALRERLIAREFAGWQGDREFLLHYMEMIRVRSPLFFEEQGPELAESTVATITSVDEVEKKITHETPRRLSEDEVHDMTLAKMREGFSNGMTLMANFHWQLRTTFDPYNPIVASEEPLFVKGTKTQTERAMTMDLLTDEGSEIWFPICWQAVLVGRVREPLKISPIHSHRG